jgi:hypothetical protein
MSSPRGSRSTAGAERGRPAPKSRHARGAHAHRHADAAPAVPVLAGDEPRSVAAGSRQRATRGEGERSHHHRHGTAGLVRDRRPAVYQPRAPRGSALLPSGRRVTATAAVRTPRTLRLRATMCGPPRADRGAAPPGEEIGLRRRTVRGSRPSRARPSSLHMIVIGEAFGRWAVRTRRRAVPESGRVPDSAFIAFDRWSSWASRLPT